MEVILSAPRGFCAGVVRAIEVVEICLERYGAPVYVKHQIVHNPYVVAELEREGAITVESVDEVPSGSLVVFSAHGSAPVDFQQAKERDLCNLKGHRSVGGIRASIYNAMPREGVERLAEFMDAFRSANR